MAPRPEAQVHAYEQYVGAASALFSPKYRPRQPEKTVLYKIVQENLEMVLAEAKLNSEYGFGYPKFVEKESGWATPSEKKG